MRLNLTKDQLISAILFGIGLGFILYEGEEALNINEYVRRFYNKYKDIFIKLARKYGYDPLILMAHALHESTRCNRFGSCKLSALASKFNNFFGYKATKELIRTGRYVLLTTYEWRKSKTYPDSIYFRNPRLDKCVKDSCRFVGQSPFAAFKTSEEGIEYYINRIRTLKRYRKAWDNRTNAKEYFSALVDGGYTTQSKEKYVKSCMTWYNRLLKIRNEEISHDVT